MAVLAYNATATLYQDTADTNDFYLRSAPSVFVLGESVLSSNQVDGTVLRQISPAAAANWFRNATTIIFNPFVGQWSRGRLSDQPASDTEAGDVLG